MKGLQPVLDNNRAISLHCYIRNSVIVFTLYYLLAVKWSWTILFLPVIIEFIMEFITYVLRIQIDPDENKTKNCYYWFDKISRAHPELDYYTEGMYYDNKHISMKEAQNNKFAWMCKEGKITHNTRVLDIGSGRCDFLLYAKENYGAKVTGCTISKDQVLPCKKKGIDAFVIDITNDPIPEEYKGKFDVVVLNGSAEHFRQHSNPLTSEKFWNKFYNKISVLFDKNSTNKRVVITMIHHRKPLRKQPISDQIHFWFLDKGFGGSYPEGKYGLVKALDDYKIITMRDSTEDYNLYSDKFGAISRNNMKQIAYNMAMIAPTQLLLNPYFLHIIFSTVGGSWGNQFKYKKNGKPPPMLHQWIVLQYKPS